ncbi:chemotaxis protein CheW [Lutispora thermophila]|uniref:Chemotaxis protein CheW n=1 Tax=Lutispora thermophila DSM 19022 TaxID=1122184 RepID=A0A1M6D5Z4_9FIRM|nr:chemotaxis protein CheW [Lutispora thermophila]SHI68682.1 purine-binding chemotaxis protein CheW [Lutispora thermophila DSM 19022]
MTETLDQNIMEKDTLGDRFLTFQLDKEVYGIEIRNVTEIIGIQAITEVPELPDYIRGIINLRGKIIPVMDVRLRFKKNFREYNDRTCVIVVNIHEQTIGLVVDSVSEVISIPETEIVAPPEVGKEGNKYIKGIGKQGNEVKLLLDCEKLLNHQDAEYLNKIN